MLSVAARTYVERDNIQPKSCGYHFVYKAGIRTDRAQGVKHEPGAR